MTASSEIKGCRQRAGFVFVSEKWKPPSIIWTETRVYGRREVGLLKDHGNFENFDLFECVSAFCMCVY